MHELVAKALGKEFDMEVRQEPADINGIKRFSLVAPDKQILRRPAELWGWLRANTATPAPPPPEEQTVTKDVGETSDGFHTFNELYEHRHMLTLALMREMSVGYHRHRVTFSNQHHDGTRMTGFFLVTFSLFIDGSNNPTNVTYHLPDRLWDAAIKTGAAMTPRGEPWDGHTSQDVLKRLLMFATCQ